MNYVHRLELVTLPIGEDLPEDMGTIVHVLNVRPPDTVRALVLRSRVELSALELADIAGEEE